MDRQGTDLYRSATLLIVAWTSNAIYCNLSFRIARTTTDVQVQTASKPVIAWPGDMMQLAMEEIRDCVGRCIPGASRGGIHLCGRWRSVVAFVVVGAPPLLSRLFSLLLFALRRRVCVRKRRYAPQTGILLRKTARMNTFEASSWAVYTSIGIYRFSKTGPLNTFAEKKNRCYRHSI